MKVRSILTNRLIMARGALDHGLISLCEKNLYEALTISREYDIVGLTPDGQEQEHDYDQYVLTAEGRACPTNKGIAL